MSRYANDLRMRAITCHPIARLYIMHTLTDVKDGPCIAVAQGQRIRFALLNSTSIFSVPAEIKEAFVWIRTCPRPTCGQGSCANSIWPVLRC